MIAFIVAALLLAGTAEAGQDWELSTVFDETIQEKGLEVQREGLTPEELAVDGKKVWTWGARQGSAKGVPHGRSILIKVTDERFRNGKQPAVDIEVVYHKNFNMPIRLLADTDQGSRTVSSAYWGNKGWHTMRARVDGAFFGARRHGKADDKMQTDGFDLRLNTYNQDFHIRSIKVRGYDLDENVDYARLLKLESVAAPDDLLLFTPGQKETLGYTFWNISHKPVDGELAYTVTNREGKVLGQGHGPAVVPGSQRAELPVQVDTTGFKYGVYSINLTLTDKTTGASLLQHESYLGVCSGGALPKAKEGEFLYGLDLRLDHYDDPGERLVKWTDVMGVDIIRGGGFNAEKPEEIEAALRLWEPRGVRIMPMYEPPRDMKEESLARRARAVEEAARRFPQLKYWELGNEPDLPGFWPGTMESYVQGYTAMYQAIKRGNPDTVVGSGGLSFAHEIGKARSREFIERVDPNYVDIWTYHGHGPLVKAERAAFENVRRVVREVGKDTKPFMETESGVAARQKSQEDVQARTAIQKIVYAQSVGQPLFIWFRLLMFTEGYGNLRTEQEPRPSVLAYRAVVEALRGHRFESLVDLETADTEGYLFEQHDGAGRALVLWSNRPASHNIYLALAPNGSSVRDARVLDMYGNPSPLNVGVDGVASVTVTESPVFVKWETSEPAHAIKPAPGPLNVPDSAQLVLGKENRVGVQVRNPSDRPLSAVVKAEAVGKAPLEVTPAEMTVNLQPREARGIEFTVKVGRDAQQVRWPEVWTAFVPVAADVDLSRFIAIPDVLPAFDGKGESKGQRVYPKDHTIDFTRLGVTYSMKLPAVVMAVVESDADQTVTIGASADYWMAWFVNGRPVYGTLENGNGGGYSILDHAFTVPLKKGRNLLACQVLSGTQGFKVLIGSPTAVARMRKPNEADALRVLLEAGGKELASDQVGLEYVRPIAPLRGMRWTDAVERWDAVEPTAVLDEGNVSNYWFKHPDSSRWWRGESDLSAVGWLACDRQKVYLVVRVKDDSHVPAQDADDMAQCDSLRLGMTRHGDDLHEYTIGLAGGAVAVVKNAGATGEEGSKEIEAQVERIDARGEMVYRVALDRGLVGADTFFINFAVNDNDSDYAKQAIEWRPGMVESNEPASWYRAGMPE